MADLESIIMNNQSSSWDELYQWYINNRMLVVNANIDSSIIEDFIMYIIKWNKEDVGLPPDKRRPIKLFISSPGGDVFNENVFVDVITASKTPVWGVGLDLVASAAYVVFLACHERYVFSTTSLLQHEGEITIENSRSKAKQTQAHLDLLEIKVKNFILSRTNMTSEQYDEIYDVEYWMDAAKAKELGVVDYIIGEDCELEDVLS